MEKRRQSERMERDWKARAWGVAHMTLSHWGRPTRDRSVGRESCGYLSRNIPGKCSSSIVREGARSQGWDQRVARSQIPQGQAPWVSFQERQNVGRFEGRSDITEYVFTRTSVAAVWKESRGKVETGS